MVWCKRSNFISFFACFLYFKKNVLFDFNSSDFNSNILFFQYLMAQGTLMDSSHMNRLSKALCSPKK